MKRHAEAGFTLVETLVAIVVLAFGLIAVTNLLVVAASSNSVANQSTAATTIATQQMEVLKDTSFQNLVAGGNLGADTAGYFRDDDVAGVGRIHTRWTIARSGGGTYNTTYAISVRSEGTGIAGGQRSRADFTALRTCADVTIGCPAFP